jgi:hypothetical protein
MLAWYTFAIGFIKTKAADSSESMRWFSMALLLLGISTFGAWGVGIIQYFDAGQVLISKALTHFFLSTFTEGWVVLVILATAIQSMRLTKNDLLFSPQWLRIMIVVGAPLTFSYGIDDSLLPSFLLGAARAGGLLTSTAIIVVVFAIVSRCKHVYSVWFWPVLFLGMKGMVQLVVSVFPSGLWFSDHVLRIVYLHLLLLGSFSLTGFTYLHTRYKLSNASFRIILVAILLLLISLLLPTALLPAALKGSWIYYTMVVAAALPPLAVCYQWIQILKRKTKSAD